MRDTKSLIVNINDTKEVYPICNKPRAKSTNITAAGKVNPSQEMIAPQ